MSDRQSSEAIPATPDPRAFVTDYQRMWDLVRSQRSELLDAGLITLAEYALLAMGETRYKPGQGSPSARRLESYDELRAALTAKDKELRSLSEQREHWMNFSQQTIDRAVKAEAELRSLREASASPSALAIAEQLEQDAKSIREADRLDPYGVQLVGEDVVRLATLLEKAAAFLRSGPQ